MGCRRGESRPSVERAGRTVDGQAERDGVDDDHHGHGGLALALGAFGTGVMDEFLFGTSEEGAHCGTVVGYLGVRASGNDDRLLRTALFQVSSRSRPQKKNNYWYESSQSNQLRFS